MEAIACNDMTEHNVDLHKIMEGLTSEDSSKKTFGAEADSEGKTIANGKETKKASTDGKEPPLDDLKAVLKNSLLKTTDKA